MAWLVISNLGTRWILQKSTSLQARHLHDAGYNILTYDLRNLGRSGTGNDGLAVWVVLVGAIVSEPAGYKPRRVVNYDGCGSLVVAPGGTAV